MIARLASRSAWRLGAAVLLRDALRNARRWQTHALRMLFSAVLMGFFLAAVWVVTTFGRDWLDPASLGRSARIVFVAFAVMQVLVATVLAPMAVASAVIEERDQNTADLLLLTRLGATRIFVGKVVAKVLLLMMVVLGAMPVQALVTSLGGVSAIEVVAVTSHALLAVAVMGAMGGFFAIFTRSPVVSALAALFYGLVAFLVVPLAHATMTADWRSLADLSPLFGTTARDAWALLPIASYLPVLWLLATLGGRFYEIRISGGTLYRFIQPASWSVRAVWWVGVSLALSLATALPLAVVGSYFGVISAASGGSTVSAWVGGLSRAFLWAWSVGALLVGTWFYLRVAMDVVLTTDDMLGVRRPLREAPSAAVWENPVLWRMLNGRAWHAIGPTFGLWFVAILVAAYSMVWVIPGALLAMGGAGALAAIALTLWMAARSIEEERRTASLDILLTTRMRSVAILGAKALGVAAPTLPLLLVSVPFIIGGAFYAQVLFAIAERGSFLKATALGLGASAWLIALWLFTLCGAMCLALALRRPQATYAVGVGVLTAWMVLPPAIAAFTRGVWWVALPFRLINPLLVSHPSLVEIGVSLLALLLGAGVLFTVACVKLRAWGLRHD